MFRHANSRFLLRLAQVAHHIDILTRGNTYMLTQHSSSDHVNILRVDTSKLFPPRLRCAVGSMIENNYD